MTGSDSKVTYDGVADAYERRIGRWSRLYIPALLAAAHIQQSDTVLDVATGTGEVIYSVRQQIGSACTIFGCDASIPMLLTAQNNLGGNVFGAMDAAALAYRDGSVDAVTCQLGLMFFPDAERALLEFHRVLREDRWMAACVWSSEERAPFVSIFPDVMADYVSVSREILADGTSLGDEQTLRKLVSSAGFRDVQVKAEIHAVQFSNIKEYWEPIEAGGSPTAELYLGLPQALRNKVREEVQTRMLPYFNGDRLTLETEALIVSGRK